MTADALTAKIRRLIALNGPMPVSDYMAICLLDPDHGYYTRSEPFGKDGDFITAPEISQLFGEIIGAWLINTWRRLGRPTPFVLAEAGPGRGTLMKDILRAGTIDPAFADAAQPTLIEASPKLRAVQAATLADAAGRTVWLDSLDQLPDLPLIMVTNEFFDALPFRQFILHEGKWVERCVGLNEEGVLQWQLGTAQLSTDQIPANITQAAQEGAIYEISPSRENTMAVIAKHIAQHGGAAINFDYGHTETAIGDTFQAVKKHTFADPLDTPGNADLTSHVDFDALSRSARTEGAFTFPIMTQGEFLLQCGLLERAGQLGANKPSALQVQIRADVQRLAGNEPEDMGDLFKVFCIAQSDQVALAPFSQ
ncbi:MAG: class I SAM-dependent methyltransferase [Pseudomonadota bacterium]